MKSRLALVAVCVLISACSTGTKHAVTITNTPVPGLKSSANMDVVDIDQKAQRVYATDRTDSGIDVFDVSKPKASYIKTISLPASPSGVAVAPDLGRVFVGLSDGSVAFIDMATDKVLQQAPTGGKSVDLIEYSAERHEIYASNGDQGTVAAINANDGTKRMIFNLGRVSIEQPRYNPGDHLLYASSPDLGIFQIDPSTGAIKNKISLGTCHSNGMAIDPKRNQALVACRSWVLRVNLHQPSDQHAFTQVAGGDIIVYDAKVDRFLVGAPGQKPAEAAVFGGNPIDYIGAVGGDGFGNSAVYDESSGMVYVLNVRQGKAGVSGFELPTGEISWADVPVGVVAAAAALIVVVFVVMVRLGRVADPIHRRARQQPAPAPAKRRREQVPGEIRAGARSWTRKPESPQN